MLAVTEYGFYGVNNIVINTLRDIFFWDEQNLDNLIYDDFTKKETINKKDIIEGSYRIAKFMKIKWLHKNLLNYSLQDSNPLNFDKMENKCNIYFAPNPHKYSLKDKEFIGIDIQSELNKLSNEERNIIEKEIKEKGLFYYSSRKFDEILFNEKYKFNEISSILQFIAEEYIRNELKKSDNEISLNYLEKTFSNYDVMLELVDVLHKQKNKNSNPINKNYLQKIMEIEQKQK